MDPAARACRRAGVVLSSADPRRCRVRRPATLVAASVAPKALLLAAEDSGRDSPTVGELAVVALRGLASCRGVGSVKLLLVSADVSKRRAGEGTSRRSRGVRGRCGDSAVQHESSAAAQSPTTGPEAETASACSQEVEGPQPESPAAGSSSYPGLLVRTRLSKGMERLGTSGSSQHALQ